MKNYIENRIKNRVPCNFHGKLTQEDIYIVVRKSGERKGKIDLRCIKCLNKTTKKYLNNISTEKKEIIYINKKKWRLENPEKIKVSIKKTRDKYINKYKDLNKKIAKKNRDELKDGYVIACIRQKEKIEEIPKELIDLKRKNILLKRIIKQKESNSEDKE